MTPARSGLGGSELALQAFQRALRFLASHLPVAYFAGVAALIIGKNGPLPPAQVEAILRQSADDLGKPGNDDFYGRGFVNAGRAVQ